MNMIIRIADITMAMSERARPWFSMDPHPDPWCPHGNDLRSHQGSPGKRPALLESAQVPRQGRREHTLASQLQPGRPQHCSHAAVLPRNLVHTGDHPASVTL